MLAGECVLIVEGQERRLKAWDFVHCPGGTEHIIVATGDRAAIVVAVGARGRGVGGGVVYTVSELAARYGASVERETTSAAEAYEKVRKDLPRSRWVEYREDGCPTTTDPAPDGAQNVSSVGKAAVAVRQLER